MSPRIKPIKLKIIAALLIDAFLFLFLLLVGYAFFMVPVRAENIDCPTETGVPSQTCIPEPSATNTPEPSPTDVLEPSATSTPEPSPTDVIEPSATSTIEPSSTSTLVLPSPTNTPEPSLTPTLKPTNTLTSTIEPSQTSSPTIPPPPDTDTPEPRRTPSPTIPPSRHTDTPAPSPTRTQNTPTPRATSTLVVNTCPDCYIVKDFRELIVSGLYTADLLNTEDISSTFKVSITLYNGYKGVVVGKAIGMADTQPANEVMHVETPLWCISPITGEVYWIHTVASAQNSTGEIWFLVDEWVRINLSNDKMIEP
jgi:hypothetical protein